MKVTISQPDWVPSAVKDAIKTLTMIDSGVAPPALNGLFLRTIALRLLRCVYGSDLDTAIGIRDFVLQRVAEDQETEKRIAEAMSNGATRAQAIDSLLQDLDK